MLHEAWPWQKQFRAHRLPTQRTTKAPELGVNETWGMPQAIFRCKPGPQSENLDYDEVACEIHVDTRRVRDKGYMCGPEDIMGISMLCPRCGGGCYIRGPAMPVPGSFHIDIHWNTLVQARDEKLYPTFTVREPIRCDYLDSEINGITAPRASGRCGWRGRIENGIAHDEPLIIRGAR